MASEQAAKCLAILLAITLTAITVSSTPSNKRKSMTIIQEVNREGPYIGLITVYPPEEDAFFATRAFEIHPHHPFVDLSGRRFRVGKIHGRKVIYVRCGVGMMNAAVATQQMVDLFDILGIVHFGISGNANDSMSIGDVTIPKQFAHTGIWDWLKPNGTLPSNDITHLNIGSYNVPKGVNLLGHIGYSYEQFFSETGKPNTAQPLFWAKISKHWLQLATKLEGMELQQCVNSSNCLPQKPKLVVGLKGSTSNIFVDNAAYRDFLFQTFHVSSVDMESAAVVKFRLNSLSHNDSRVVRIGKSSLLGIELCMQTTLSNGFPVIVIRGLSDLAGGQAGPNSINIFGPLAALNAATAVIQFIRTLSDKPF